MKNWIVGTAITFGILAGMNQAMAETCMTSDATVFVDGQYDVFKSNSLKNRGIKNGMFQPNFEDPKYNIVQHDENVWIGHMNVNGMNIVATMNYNTSTYTKQMSAMNGETSAVMFIVNKCM